jgi:hypothetical protein
MTDITVTQADREAAWPTRPTLYGGDYHKDDWHKGTYDDGRHLQSYAAHRVAALAAERERGQKVADALRSVIDDLKMRVDCKLGDDHRVVDVGRGVWGRANYALTEWEAGK